jgi:calcium/calmodulin-dependent protein kinase kinase 2
VTKKGTDPLLSEADNLEKSIEPPNELEVNHALTRKMDHMLVLVGPTCGEDDCYERVS